ncbi:MULTISPECIES: hypothetical protein [unclassified Mesorhizobium]|uniref:hypothetical protein n=1 Tax=unclassified Mesorhizobium TaxID=325217 RepID=UPI000F754E32|nr:MULTISPECIES: hypothetical protein [unclassified Mesorhizobium]AZO54752.1 hypothetical protein EJ077_15765 [Mesorhizobium sp. M8A.F.Ca.ET.057.01.1.1]RWE44327.1 MAG: hypothetical protein EOS80_20575 [Mesorhizobium sp.]TJX77845.1 MAG: hypothetical protein E5W21_02920 [Mesorhizobium sp.]
MANQFTDIKIKALDDSASGPSGEGALMRLVLRLSQSAPAPWSQYFNKAWQQHIYMMKRRASVSGDRLEIICMPNELQADHIPELNKIITQTNAAYGAYAAEQTRLRQKTADESQRQKDDLAKLKGQLKFD